MPDSIAETYESLTEEEQDMIFPPAFPPAYGAPQAATLEITGLADSWVDMTVNTRLDFYPVRIFATFLSRWREYMGSRSRIFLRMCSWPSSQKVRSLCSGSTMAGSQRVLPPVRALERARFLRRRRLGQVTGSASRASCSTPEVQSCTASHPQSRRGVVHRPFPHPLTRRHPAPSRFWATGSSSNASFPPDWNDGCRGT